MKIRFASLLAVLALGAVACDDSSSGMNGNAGQNGQKFTCSVQIQPTEFDYEVRGNQLQVTWIDATTQTLARVGTGSGVFGTWALSEDYNAAAKLRVKLNLRLDSGRATAVSECSGPGGRRTSVSASSPATITDTTVTILDGDAKQTTF